MNSYKSTDDKLKRIYVTMWNFNRSYPCFQFKGEYWNGFPNPLVNLHTLMQMRQEVISNHRHNDIDENLEEFLEDYFDPKRPSLIIDDEVYYNVGGGLCWDEMDFFENWKDMETNFYDSVKFLKTSESHMSHLEAEYVIHYFNDSVWIAKMHGGEFYTCVENQEFQSPILYEVEQFLLEHWCQYEYLDQSQYRKLEVQ